MTGRSTTTPAPAPTCDCVVVMRVVSEGSTDQRICRNGLWRTRFSQLGSDWIDSLGKREATESICQQVSALPTPQPLTNKQKQDVSFLVESASLTQPFVDGNCLL